MTATTTREAHSGEAVGDRCVMSAYGAPPPPDSVDETDEDTTIGHRGLFGFCHALSGTGVLGIGGQRTIPADPALQPRVPGGLLGSVTFGGLATLESGRFVGDTYVGSTVSVLGTLTPASRLFFTEASLRVGRVQGGYAASRFIYWSGDDIASWALLPSRAVTMAAIDVFRHGPWSLTVAGEYNTPTPAPVPPVPVVAAATPNRLPDLVVQARYGTDRLELHGAAGFRRIDSAGAGADSRIGIAATFGLKWTFDALGAEHVLAGQIAYARDLPTYLGSSFDVRAIGALARPDEATRGWSAVGSLRRAWTPTISTNLVLSYLDIRLPALGSGRFEAVRAAANIVWTPSDELKVIWELGYGRSTIDLPDRALPQLELSARGYSGLVMVQRSF
ncbi:MAG: hypothetical protein K2X45_15865 [Phreatobacter sp.]|nr:hypothetical protein [Phreatobacter sp.]